MCLQTLTCPIRHGDSRLIPVLFDVLFFLEEPYYGSGSGSGGGIDDDDSLDTGSGLGPYDPQIEDTDVDDEDRCIHMKVPGSTINVAVNVNNGTSGGSSSTGSSGSSPGIVSPPSIDKHPSIHAERPIEEIDNEIPHSAGSGAPGTARTPPMSIRRALFTYFLPIYMAWFGGIVCELL